MIDKYDEQAKQNGAFIIPMCGFDRLVHRLLMLIELLAV